MVGIQSIKNRKGGRRCRSLLAQICNLCLVLQKQKIFGNFSLAILFNYSATARLHRVVWVLFNYNNIND